jgi:FMN-dependent oxidoreductase (nitrilotriacetate monooxygenase family)
MAKKRQIKLGATITGAGTSHNTWKRPEIKGNESVDFEYYKNKALQAEAGKFDFVFIVDSPYITANSAPHFLNRLEPLTVLSAIGSVTEKIGLVGTVTTSYTEPYNVARQFASLDHLSGGRAGWNVVTTGLEGAAANYGRSEHYEHSVRYRRAAEHVAVVKGLWDSWEDDALVRNKETGQFFDETKLHELNFKGEFFSVKGPLNISRSRQGHPVLFQAGGSDSGRDLAARSADAIFARSSSLEEAKAFYRDVKQRAESYGRRGDQILIFPGISPIVADTEEEAIARHEEHAGKLTIEEALVELGRPFSYYDFSKHDLDAPFPDLGDLGSNAYRTAAERIKRTARENNLTLRETALLFARPKNHFVGTPEQIADRLQLWFEEEAADGFIIYSEVSEWFTEFVNKVVPILQKRGLFRTEYESDTFRGNLGLEFPENIHTKRRKALAEKEGAKV